MPKGTDKYKFCNHHHEISDNHELVDFGDGELVANKQAIPLLKALSEVGLRTRTHHIDDCETAFISIVLDSVEIEIREILEGHSDRTKYNGKKELLIKWNRNINLTTKIMDTEKVEKEKELNTVLGELGMQISKTARLTEKVDLVAIRLNGEHHPCCEEPAKEVGPEKSFLIKLTTQVKRLTDINSRLTEYVDNLEKTI